MPDSAPIANQYQSILWTNAFVDPMVDFTLLDVVKLAPAATKALALAGSSGVPDFTVGNNSTAGSITCGGGAMMVVVIAAAGELVVEPIVCPTPLTVIAASVVAAAVGCGAVLPTATLAPRSALAGTAGEVVIRACGSTTGG